MNFELPEGVKLSGKRKLFFINYFDNGYNGTKAAKDAGYSETSAHNQANRLIKSDDGQKIINLYFQQLAESNRLRKEAAQQFLLDVIETDLTDFIEIKDGKPLMKPTNQIPENKRKLINEIKISPAGVITIKTFSKETAREMLNKIDGHYEKDNEQKKATGPTVYIPDNNRGKEKSA